MDGRDGRRRPGRTAHTGRVGRTEATDVDGRDERDGHGWTRTDVDERGRTDVDGCGRMERTGRTSPPAASPFNIEAQVIFFFSRLLSMSSIILDAFQGLKVQD